MQTDRTNSPIAFLFCSSLQRVGQAHPHWGGQSALFSLLIYMLILSRNTFTLTEAFKIMFNQISRHYFAQSSRHIESTITTMTSKLRFCGGGGHMGIKLHSHSWVSHKPFMDICSLIIASVDNRLFCLLLIELNKKVQIT